MDFIKNTCHGYLDYPSARVCTSMCNTGFDVLGRFAIGLAMIPLQTIIHESGHAIASHLLFTNSKPKIKLIDYGYGGGSCRFDPTVLSKTGRWLGSSNALAICSAAGPVVQMATALALLRFFPGNGYSAVALAANSSYAISALFQKSFYTNGKEADTHDFIDVKINKGKIVAGTLIITSIALGIFGIYSLMTQVIANMRLLHISGGG